MIAFRAVRHSSISRVTSEKIRPRTTTNEGVRGQLQPQLQPPGGGLSLMGLHPVVCSRIRVSEPPAGEHFVSRVRSSSPMNQRDFIR